MRTNERIRQRTKSALEENGKLFGQCITAVGWIQNTVPSDAPGESLVELPMNDVSGPGIAIGSALSGTPSILVLRFQSLLWLASSPIANYASKAERIWGYRLPLMIRAIAAEQTGPIHTNCNHHLFMGLNLRIEVPMTAVEIDTVWNRWEKERDVVLVSEHRRSYDLEEELEDELTKNPDVILFPISASRIEAKAAAKLLRLEGYRVSIINIRTLQPLDVLSLDKIEHIKTAKMGLVTDSSTYVSPYVVAYQIIQETGLHTFTLAHLDSPAVSQDQYEGTPTAQKMVHFVKGRLPQ